MLISIDTDGLSRACLTDPPGQSSIYITSGDTWNENYRLSTFSQFPETPVIITDLASSGFYFTGYKDRVKCFSCGISVENWIYGDDPTSKRWHQGDCDFANGRDTNNQPIYDAFRQWRIASPLVHNTQNGLNQSTNVQRPTLVSNIISGGNFTQQNIPLVQNLTGGIPHTSSSNHSQSTASSSNTATVNTEHQDRYPCSDPLNPHMMSVINRLESFKPRNGIRWPAESLRASIDELVNAGFFYLHERDRVKCFYCNGGLQNWDYEDNPWTEHVKWFPSCEYALRVKGTNFVENIVSQFPNIGRPNITRPHPREASLPGRDIGPVLSTAEAVEQALATLHYAKHAREMGFDTEAIKTVLERKYNANQMFFNRGEDFMDALFLYNAHQQRIAQQPNNGIGSSIQQNQTAPSPVATQPHIATSSSSVNGGEGSSTSSVASELEELEKSRLCKVCAKSPSNIVIIPCGHLASCEGCIKKLKKCPICKRPIQDTIKTFRS